MQFKEGEIFTILKQKGVRKENQGFRYFKLKYWDGRNWIVRFIKKGDTDWIALSEARIQEMLINNIIEIARPKDMLEAVMLEKKSELKK